jgi:DNA polymerase III delta prime subunit
MNNDMWTVKHKPTSFNTIKGNGENIKKAINWINTFASSKPDRRLLLLSGVPGTGKTLLAQTLATSGSIEYVHINCSASRSFDELRNLILPYIDSTGIEYTTRVIVLLDEIDGQPKNSPIWKFLSDKVLPFITNPFIATCNALYEIPKDFQEHHCNILLFRRQYHSTIRNHLLEIAMKEGFKLTTQEADDLVLEGDMRASITALQIYCMSGFKIPQLLQHRSVWTETRDALTHNISILPDLPPLKMLEFIEENGKHRVTGVDRYHFYNMINYVSSLISSYNEEDALLLLGMISCSMTYPQLQPDEDSPYVKIHEPSISTKFFLTRNLHKTISNLSLKICPDYLTSSIDFFENIFPILQYQSINDLSYARSLVLKYSLEKDEIAILLDSTTNDPRINKLLTPDKSLTTLIHIPDKISPPLSQTETLPEQEMFA